MLTCGLFESHAFTNTALGCFGVTVGSSLRCTGLGRNSAWNNQHLRSWRSFVARSVWLPQTFIRFVLEFQASRGGDN